MDVISEIKFSGALWQWRGPAPFYFVTLPKKESAELKKISKMVTYGWGMIPVVAKINKTEWKTSLFPQEDLYVIPVKKEVRMKEKISEGDNVTITIRVT